MMVGAARARTGGDRDEDAAGDVFITWNAPRYVARRHHVRGERDTLRAIATALRNLATAAEQVGSRNRSADGVVAVRRGGAAYDRVVT